MISAISIAKTLTVLGTSQAFAQDAAALIAPIQNENKKYFLNGNPTPALAELLRTVADLYFQDSSLALETLKEKLI